jgi:hypothetical protein
VAQAAQLLRLVVTPFTPSLRPAHSRHKEQLMAHFAKVQNGIVTQVIVAEPEFFDTFVDSTPGEWIQTSYNTRGGVHYGQDGQPDGGVALRKNYAGIGFTYDKTRDAFIPPQPYPSWTLNEDSCLWEPPVAYPEDGQQYRWDENTQSWEVNNG